MPRLRVTWTDPSTGEPQLRVLPFPVTIGSAPDNQIVLGSHLVAPRHAVVTFDTLGMIADDLTGKPSLTIDGKRVGKSLVTSGAVVVIGPFALVLTLDTTEAAAPPVKKYATIAIADYQGPAQAPVREDTTADWPPASFQQQNVPMASLVASGLTVTTIDYLTVGAGIGSFAFVDTLLAAGVRSDQVIALGTDPVPHSRYRRLCQNSQIPDAERLRSNSDATADNIWGWPGYAMREITRDAFTFHPFRAVGNAWKIFAEPALAQTYTPRAIDVYQGIDKEAKRIGWTKVMRYGRVRAIRKTDDGRYVVAYSGQGPSGSSHAFVVARHLHLATGYPALQFLPDLQAYRETTGDFHTVVNAYEQHDHVYAHLRQNGGVVLLRGRGIVASRLLQRIVEERRHNRNIQVIHLLRTPLTRGHRYRLARRSVRDHFELQPFNWPKATFGGDLRKKLARSTPEERKALLTDWGGTTTAPRKDWRKLLREGRESGWYRAVFGEVENVEKLSTGMIATTVRVQGGAQQKLLGTFIVDATGLDAKVTANPLLNDLITHYKLELNPLGRLSVTRDFELAGLANGPGHAFAAGAMTLGGPYAPVDSFLGLQFAARCAVDALSRAGAPRVASFGPIRSVWQWIKWTLGVAP